MVWAPSTYVNLNTLKTYLGMQGNGSEATTEDDLFVQDWATAVARNVDDFCGRQFGQVATAETRYYTAKWDSNECKTYIEIDDLQDITGFKLYDTAGTEITTSYYTLGPRNAVLKGSVYTRATTTARYSGEVSALGKWGWAAIPSSVISATYMQAKRISVRRNSPYGIAGSPTDGSEIRLLAKLDPDFQVALQPYVRKWYVA